MKWIELTIHTTEIAVEMVSAILHDLGSDGVAIEESGTLNKQRDTSFGQWYELPLNDIPEGEAVVKGYFVDASPDMIEQTIDKLRQTLWDLKDYGIDIGSADITHQQIDEEDWANEWKQYYKPVQISESLVIKPTWEPYEASDHEVVIEMDPGMAFGTGTHETTALCLRTIERVIQPGDHVIDIGTGSGILAIAAAKLGAQHVLAIDLDPVAVASARENTALNELDHCITVRDGDLLNIIPQFQMHDEQAQYAIESDKINLGISLPVQLVIANILAEIIMTFVDDVHRILASGGIYIASGIIKKKEADVISRLEGSGFVIKDRYYENDWVAIVAKKV